MRAVIVYESMYGNTRLVAEAIAEGMRPVHDVAVVPVRDAGPEVVAGAQIVVVGGPTHAHGMSRPRTRQAAAEMAEKSKPPVALEEGATGSGVRDWLDSLAFPNVFAASFDTRVHMPAALTGRASKGIDRELSRRGVHRIAEPESFFVTKEGTLEAGEAARARHWGEQLAAATAAIPTKG
jgi:flavodoxin